MFQRQTADILAMVQIFGVRFAFSSIRGHVSFIREACRNRVHVSAVPSTNDSKTTKKRKRNGHTSHYSFGAVMHGTYYGMYHVIIRSIPPSLMWKPGYITDYYAKLAISNTLRTMVHSCVNDNYDNNDDNDNNDSNDNNNKMMIRAIHKCDDSLLIAPIWKVSFRVLPSFSAAQPHDMHISPHFATLIPFSSFSDLQQFHALFINLAIFATRSTLAQRLPTFQHCNTNCHEFVSFELSSGLHQALLFPNTSVDRSRIAKSCQRARDSSPPLVNLISILP